MKDKRQKMTLAWPCGDPVLAAYVLQQAAAATGLQLGGPPPPGAPVGPNGGGLFAAVAAAAAAAASGNPFLPPPPHPPSTHMETMRPPLPFHEPSSAKEAGSSSPTADLDVVDDDEDSGEAASPKTEEDGKNVVAHEKESSTPESQCLEVNGKPKKEDAAKNVCGTTNNAASLFQPYLDLVDKK